VAGFDSTPAGWFEVTGDIYCEYHVGTRYRIESFPLPIVFFHLECEQKPNNN